MKQFVCGAVVPGCHAVFRAETDATILAQVSAHARRAHGVEEISSELLTAVQDNIDTVGV
jgi:predicted small metal-binding protein